MKALETIESARLVLQCPQQKDAEAIFLAYASDPVVTRYVGWGVVPIFPWPHERSMARDRRSDVQLGWCVCKEKPSHFLGGKGVVEK